MILPCPGLLGFAVNPTLCALGAVQLLCVAAAGVARVAEGTRFERSGQWLCFAALAVVGTACGVSIQLGPDSAAVSAASLALMTMIAVVDVNPRS